VHALNDHGEVNVSLYLQPHVYAGVDVPFIQYVACLAVVSALQEIFSTVAGVGAHPRAFPIRIKWPNDIYVALEGKSPLKIGGILCNALAAGGKYNVLVGLGLNVENEAPTTSVKAILASTAQNNEANWSAVSRELVMATFLNHFEELQEVQ
jgi:biotin---protein ligase